MKIVTSKYWFEHYEKLIHIWQNRTCVLVSFKDNKITKTKDPLHLIIYNPKYDS